LASEPWLPGAAAWPDELSPCLLLPLPLLLQKQLLQPRERLQPPQLLQALLVLAP
jgi:hypothetical protein